MADLRERIIISSVDNTAKGFKSAQNKLNTFDRTLERMQNRFLSFVGLPTLVGMIENFSKTADRAVELDAKLRLMTDGAADFNRVSAELINISLETGTSLEANTILFTRMNRAIQSLGGDSKVTTEITKLMAQGLRISGASAQESASVIRQYSQAMSSGVLRGEEFNAIMENGGRIARALAVGIGVPIGELRSMSKQGLLTAKTVNDALLSQKAVIDEEARQLPLTVGRALENINSQWMVFLQGQKEINTTFAEGLNFIASNFDVIIEAVVAFGKAAAFYFTGSVLLGYIARQKELLAVTIESELAERKRAILQNQAAIAKRLADAQAIVDGKLSLQNAVDRYNQKLKIKTLDAEIDVLKGKSAAKEKKSAVERKEEQIAKLTGKQQELAAIATLTIADTERGIIQKKLALNEAQRNSLRLQTLLSINNTRIAELKLKQDLLLADVKALTIQRDLQAQQLKNASAILGNSGNIRRIKQELLITEGALATATVKSGVAIDKLTLAEQKNNITTSEINTNLDKQTIIQKELEVSTKTLDAAKTKLAGTEAKLAGATSVLTKAKFAENVTTVETTIATGKSAAAYGNSSTQVGLLDRALNKLRLAMGVLSPATNSVSTGLSRITTVISGLIIKVPVLYKSLGMLKVMFTSTSFASKFLATNLALLNVAFAKTVTVVSKAFNFLFGLPGLIIYLGYELLSFLDLLPDWEILGHLLNKTWATFTDTLGDLTGGLIGTKGEMAKADAEFKEFSEQRVLDAQAQAEGYKDLQDQYDKVVQQREQLERDHTKYLKEQLDARLEASKNAADRNEYVLDQELIRRKSHIRNLYTAEKKHVTDVERIGNEFRDRVVKDTSETDKELITSKNQLNAALYAAEKTHERQVSATKSARLKHDLKLVKEFNDKLLSQSEESSATLLKEQKDGVKEHKRILTGKLADALDANRNAYELELIDTKEFNKTNTGLRDTYNKALADIDKKSAKSRETILKNNKIAHQKIETENATRVKKIYTEMIKHAQGEIKKMESTLDDYRQKSENILDRVAKIERDNFGDKRSEYKKTSDALRKYNSLNSDLRRADILDQQGNHEEAKKLREDAIDGLEDIVENQTDRAESAKKGSKAEVDGNRLAKQSMDTLSGAAVKLKQNYIELADSLETRIATSKEAVDGYIRVVDEADRKLSEIKELQIRTNAKEAVKELQTVVKKLSEIKSKTVEITVNKTIRVKTVQVKNGGGIIEPDRYASGGYVPRRDVVPGSGNSDTVKALLTPGEYIVKKSAVQQFGEGFFNSINRGIMPQLFAAGGMVGSGASGESIDINFNIDGARATGTFVRDDNTSRLIESLKRAGASS